MPGFALHLRAYGTRQRLDRGLKRDDRQRQKREREGPRHRDVSVALRSCSVLFPGRTRITSNPFLRAGAEELRAISNGYGPGSAFMAPRESAWANRQPLRRCNNAATP